MKSSHLWRIVIMFLGLMYSRKFTDKAHGPIDSIFATNFL